MKIFTDLYIDGRWVSGNDRIPVQNPADGTVIAEVATADTAACDAAVAAAHRAGPDWAARAPRQRRMSAVRVGPGLAPESPLGSLVSVTGRDKVAAPVEAAVASGARCTSGGQSVAGAGAFYPATVLADVAADSAILRTEIFGPVAPVVAVDSEVEAVALGNDTEYGLIAYVHGPAADAIRVAGRLEAGMVAVNRGVVSDPAAGFGGIKQSGLGREGGFEGIHEFLESKYIAVDL